MTEIQLGYGRRTQTFAFDDSRFQVLEADPTNEKPLTDVEIGAAFSDAMTWRAIMTSGCCSVNLACSSASFASAAES